MPFSEWKFTLSVEIPIKIDIIFTGESAFHRWNFRYLISELAEWKKLWKYYLFYPILKKWFLFLCLWVHIFFNKWCQFTFQSLEILLVLFLQIENIFPFLILVGKCHQYRYNKPHYFILFGTMEVTKLLPFWKIALIFFN